MIYYHGTSSNFVEDILKNGLVPKPANTWKVEVYFGPFDVMSPDDSDRVGNIYLSPDKSDSLWYAVNKAAYYRAKPDHYFKWSQYAGGPNDSKTIDRLTPMYPAKKLEDVYVPDAKPVLFEVKVTPRIKAQLIPDEKDHYNSVRCTCVIPPQYLKLVWQG